MARWLILIPLVPYAGWLILAYDFHFIDYVNLAFHEAGHIFFTPLGRTMHFLGGTIFQFVFPVAVAVHFWRKERRVEALIGVFWFAESMMYMAWYMADANTRVIPLAGGGIHDWHWLFSRWGMLASAESIAGFFHVLASLILIGCLVLIARQSGKHS